MRELYGKEKCVRFSLLVDSIQSHFDQAPMSGIAFLCMPFSYGSYFYGFRKQFQFHMPVLCQICCSTVQASGRH